MLTRFLILALPLTIGAASAGPDHSAHRSPDPSPYSGLEARPIKALAEKDINDLKMGRGMRMALAAELNGYPGPMHVLELADQLALSDEQRTRVQALQHAMRAEAVVLGQKLIAQEAELDQQFAGRTVTPSSLRDVTAEIGATQAALRAVHLRYHLDTAAILTPPQISRYAVLRGYAGADQPFVRQAAEATSDIARVNAASQAFVAAISARDIRAMEKLWAHEPDVTFIGPLSTKVVVGWDSVKKAWEMRFSQFDRVTVSLAESHVRSNGDVAWAVGIENIQLLRKDGETLNLEAFVTNVFEKRDGDWRVVSHHAAPISREAR
jgi:ketosteroid isomerase-like protein